MMSLNFTTNFGIALRLRNKRKGEYSERESGCRFNSSQMMFYED